MSEPRKKMASILAISGPRLKIDIKASKELWEAIPALEQLELLTYYQDATKKMLVKLHAVQQPAPHLSLVDGPEVSDLGDFFNDTSETVVSPSPKKTSSSRRKKTEEKIDLDG